MGRGSSEQRSSGPFDKLAQVTGGQVSRAWFFTTCVLICIVWAMSGPLFGFNETWQLVINTGTTILTFLLVALLQNTQDRSDKAIHHKLDAIVEALAFLLEDQADPDDRDLIEELRHMAGVEMEASS